MRTLLHEELTPKDVSLANQAAERGEPLLFLGDGKFLPLKPWRPYRSKVSLVDEVAALASKRFDLRISSRTVRTCWEWFNKFEKTIWRDADAQSAV
jgi:hypothetical protein